MDYFVLSFSIITKVELLAFVLKYYNFALLIRNKTIDEHSK